MTLQGEAERAAREQEAHTEANRFPGRSCVLVLEWNDRGGVSLRHAGGVGVQADDAVLSALQAKATPYNTVEVIGAEAREAILEYAYGKWSRGAR